MGSGFQITCANKNSSGQIVRIGGPSWSLETHAAIVRVVTKRLRLNIVIEDRHYNIGVRGEGADAYLVLEPDGKPLHECAELPSC